MSLNVAEGHFEYVIWSNEYLDWANWHEAFEEDYSDASEEKKYQLMSDLNAEYLEDERREMDVQVGTPIIVIADIGRWDGRHTGYREIESGCLKDCLYTELDGLTWYVDDRGDFRMDGYHHDGHNCSNFNNFTIQVNRILYGGTLICRLIPFKIKNDVVHLIPFFLYKSKICYLYLSTSLKSTAKGM